MFYNVPMINKTFLLLLLPTLLLLIFVQMVSDAEKVCWRLLKHRSLIS